MRRLALLLILSLLLLPAAALADSFDFSVNAGANSSWSWGGGTSALTASTGSGVSTGLTDWNGNPLVTSVQLTVNGTNLTLGYCGGPAGVSCSFLEGSAFTFTTGNATGWDGTTATFAPGGTIAVSDDIYGDCGGYYGLSGNAANCFSGTFTGTQLLASSGGGSANFTGYFVGGSLSPTLIETLYSAGAISLDTPTSVMGSLTLTFDISGGLSAIGGSCGPSQASCFHGDSLTLLGAETVPEPGTLTLLGTGLLSLAGFLRRRMNKS